MDVQAVIDSIHRYTVEVLGGTGVLLPEITVHEVVPSSVQVTSASMETWHFPLTQTRHVGPLPEDVGRLHSDEERDAHADVLRQQMQEHASRAMQAWAQEGDGGYLAKARGLNFTAWTDQRFGIEWSCPSCHAAGKVTCSDCGGSARRTCDRCYGNHRKTCRHCWERPGSMKCGHCHAKGYVFYGEDRKTCSSCHGEGRVHCTHCFLGVITCQHCEEGRVACWNCHAAGQVRCQPCEGHGLVHDLAAIGAEQRFQIGWVLASKDPFLAEQLEKHADPSFVGRLATPRRIKHEMRGLDRQPPRTREDEPFGIRITHAAAVPAARVRVVAEGHELHLEAFGAGAWMPELTRLGEILLRTCGTAIVLPDPKELRGYTRRQAYLGGTFAEALKFPLHRRLLLDPNTQAEQQEIAKLARKDYLTEAAATLQTIVRKAYVSASRAPALVGLVAGLGVAGMALSPSLSLADRMALAAAGAMLGAGAVLLGDRFGLQALRSSLAGEALRASLAALGRDRYRAKILTAGYAAALGVPAIIAALVPFLGR